MNQSSFPNSMNALWKAKIAPLRMRRAKGREIFCPCVQLMLTKRLVFETPRQCSSTRSLYCARLAEGENKSDWYSFQSRDNQFHFSCMENVSVERKEWKWSSLSVLLMCRCHRPAVLISQSWRDANVTSICQLIPHNYIDVLHSTGLGVSWGHPVSFVRPTELLDIHLFNDIGVC